MAELEQPPTTNVVPWEETSPEKGERPAAVRAEPSGARVSRSPLSAALRRRAEADPEATASVYWEALSATKRVYLGDSWTDEPDHNVRLKAADAILNRVEGTPVSRTEVTGAEGGPVTIAALLAADPRSLE
jgi:hypothetical protein